MLVLLFPTLAVLSRRRVSALALALGVVFLHFGLTSSRYAPLWVVVTAPTLAALASQMPWFETLNVDLFARPVQCPGRPPFLVSFSFAGLLLLASPWMGNLAHHNQELMPSRALDRLLADYHGERVFHGANWGGYLTWHGWGLRPRFRTWIDDRLDVHGREHADVYQELLAAPPTWEEMLERSQVNLLCIPADTQLAHYARSSARWRLLFDDGQVAILRLAAPPEAIARVAGQSQ
jgi:hypothetical protein